MNINSLDDILQIKDSDTMLSDEVFEFLIGLDAINYERAVQKIKDYIKENKKTMNCLKAFNAILKEHKQKKQDNSISVFSIKHPETNQTLEIKTKNYYIDEENHQIIKKISKQGNNVPVCESIIVPYAISSDIKTEAKMADVMYLDTDFEWKTKRVTIAALTSTSSLSRQIGEVFVGINTNNANEMLSYFQEIISLNSKLFIPKKSVSYFGWKNESYVKNDMFIPFSEDCEYIGTDTEGKLIYDSIIKSKGTLEDWIDFTQKLRAHLPTRLAMDASFASPLLQILDTDPFSILLYGSSGLGKSHSNYVAMSIWGKSKLKEGLTFSLESTQNYLPRLLSTLKNIPACFDELKLFSGDLNLLMYIISQGQEKGRLKNDKETGEIVSKLRRSWKNICLFSGEFPIFNESSDAGALNRVLQIRVEDKPPVEFDEIRDFINKNYGTAGRSFVKHISELDEDELKQKLKKIRAEILENVDTTDKQALIMGILLLADEIASKLFYSEEQPISIDDIAPYLCSEEQVSYGIRAYKTFINIAFEKQNNFYRLSDEKDVNERPRIFWGEINDGKYIKVLKTALCKALKDANFEPEQVISEWKANDMITLTKTRKLTVHQTSVRSNPGSYIIINWIDKYMSEIEEDQFLNEKKVVSFDKYKNGNNQLMPEFKEKVENGGHLEHEDFTKQFTLEDVVNNLGDAEVNINN